MNTQGSVVKFPAQGVHFVHQQLQTFDLHMGTWETIQNDSVMIFCAEQLMQHQPDNVPVTDHVAGGFQSAGRGRIEQRTDHDRLAGQTPDFGDEGGIGALASTRRAAQQDDLLGKTHALVTEFRLKLTPDGSKNKLGVLDFKIVALGHAWGNRWRNGLSGCGHRIKTRTLTMPAFSI